MSRRCRWSRSSTGTPLRWRTTGTGPGPRHRSRSRIPDCMSACMSDRWLLPAGMRRFRPSRRNRKSGRLPWNRTPLGTGCIQTNPLYWQRTPLGIGRMPTNPLQRYTILLGIENILNYCLHRFAYCKCQWNSLLKRMNWTVLRQWCSSTLRLAQSTVCMCRQRRPRIRFCKFPPTRSSCTQHMK